MLGVRDDDASIGGDELDGEQVVDGQPVRPADEPRTAAKGDAADTDRGGVTESDDEPMLPGSGCHRACRGTPANPGDALVDVDVDAVQRAQVDDETVLSTVLWRPGCGRRPGRRSPARSPARRRWWLRRRPCPVVGRSRRASGRGVGSVGTRPEALGVGGEDLAGDGVVQRPQSISFDGQWSMWRSWRPSFDLNYT